MTKTAKTITYAAGIFTAFWLIIAFLITSVEAVAYWTPGYYEKEYTKYQVLNDLPEMNMDDLLDVTDEMMAFLRGKREDLHVYTTMGGEYREFFNDREIAHMEDVRGLFIGGLWLRRIGILITLCFAALAYFWGRKSAERTEALKRLIPKSLCIGTGAVFAVALALIGIISTDFSKYFIVFHKIFFNNDLWVLDPRTDMLINIVPEAFFFDTAARIALVFAVIAWVLRKLDLPAVPILLGMVLGKMTETNFRRALQISDGSPSIFFSSVYCIIFLLLIVLAVGAIIRGKLKEQKAVKAAAQKEA